MLQRLSAQQRFDLLIAQFEPAIRKAFLDAVAELRGAIDLRLFVERMERHDIEGALDMLHIDEAALRPLEEAVRVAFNGGGIAAVGDMPTFREPSGARVVVRFDARQPQAEALLSSHSGNLIGSITTGQLDAAREVMTQGLAEGRGARSIALDIAGRKGANGVRQGGIIGLDPQFTSYVQSMRTRLASGDPTQLRKVLGMARRDKRFDRSIAKAIREGRPLAPELLDKAVTAYSSRLLQLRAENIAQTEGMWAMNASQEEAYNQAIRKGAVRLIDLEKKWNSAGDNRVRHTHRALEGQTVGFDGVFVSPSGAVLRRPHDENAPASETIGCRCHLTYRITNFRTGQR